MLKDPNTELIDSQTIIAWFEYDHRLLKARNLLFKYISARNERVGSEKHFYHLHFGDRFGKGQSAFSGELIYVPGTIVPANLTHTMVEIR